MFITVNGHKSFWKGDANMKPQRFIIPVEYIRHIESEKSKARIHLKKEYFKATEPFYDIISETSIELIEVQLYDTKSKTTNERPTVQVD